LPPLAPGGGHFAFSAGHGLVGLVHTRSPWLMSLVQVAPLLALPAKGLLSLAAYGLQEPLRLVPVYERK